MMLNSLRHINGSTYKAYICTNFIVKSYGDSTVSVTAVNTYLLMQWWFQPRWKPFSLISGMWSMADPFEIIRYWQQIFQNWFCLIFQVFVAHGVYKNCQRERL